MPYHFLDHATQVNDVSNDKEKGMDQAWTDNNSTYKYALTYNLQWLARCNALQTTETSDNSTRRKTVNSQHNDSTDGRYTSRTLRFLIVHQSRGHHAKIDSILLFAQISTSRGLSHKGKYQAFKNAVKDQTSEDNNKDLNLVLKASSMTRITLTPHRYVTCLQIFTLKSLTILLSIKKSKFNVVDALVHGLGLAYQDR